jgi:predicted transcriptional regulator
MQVQDLIARDLITAHPGESLATVGKRMNDLGVHALPIFDDGSAVGIITSSDISPELDSDTPVVDLMSETVYQIDVAENAKEAARMMCDLGVHHLLATEDGSPAGMLSSFDLLRIILEE